MSFRIHGLPVAPFANLFALSDEALKARRALRRIADKAPGFPCRVSLEDAAPGEEVVLVHYEHHAADTPFRASHAIYVRKAAVETFDKVNEVPAMLRKRMLSLRAFDHEGLMIDADLADGPQVEGLIARLFDTDTGQPIRAPDESGLAWKVWVQEHGTRRGRQASADGGASVALRVEAPHPGIWDVRAEIAGYEPYTTDALVVSDERDATVEMRLRNRK